MIAFWYGAKGSRQKRHNYIILLGQKYEQNQFPDVSFEIHGTYIYQLLEAVGIIITLQDNKNM